MELRLNSPAGRDPAVYQWPLITAVSHDWPHWRIQGGWGQSSSGPPTGLSMGLASPARIWDHGTFQSPVSQAEVTSRLSLPDATSAHAREIVGSFGPQ